jgi:hypothetical protein
MKVRWLRSEPAVFAGDLNARAHTLVPGRLRKPLDTVVRRVAWLRQRLVPQAFQPAPRSAVDYRAAIALGLIGALIAAAGNTAFDPRVNDYWNIYFHADPNRVLNDIVPQPPGPDFHRKGGIHPIFSILLFVPVQLLMLLGVSKLAAFTALLVASAGFSAGLFYMIMRRLGLSLPASVAFAGAFMASATFVHWSPFVETYSFALLTGVTMLLVMTSPGYNPLWWILASAGTLSVTLTNWALGLATAFFHLPARKLIFVSAAAFSLVAGIALIQKIVFPESAVFFRPGVVYREKGFMQIGMEGNGYLRSWSPVQNIRSVLVTSAVAPPPALEDDAIPAGVFRLVSNQHAPLTRSLVGSGAIACWAALLVIGLWGAWRALGHRAVALSVGSYMLFQLAMHSVYGDVTFLYAANFFPALLTLAALGWLTPLRRYATSAAIGFIILAGANNYDQFIAAARMANETAANYPARDRTCPRLTAQRLCEEDTSAQPSSR